MSAANNSNTTISKSSLKTIMVQGTNSDAGKSTLVAGLCRVLKRRGVRVAPFKSQNITANSVLTAEGDEIARAQHLQAMACGIASHVDMNPLLLKPVSNGNYQVIVAGKAVGEQNFSSYQSSQSEHVVLVQQSWQRLSSAHECIVVEGAGSPADADERGTNIANMGFAEAVDCPVVLVADMDRGGLFAHVIGTLALLSASQRSRVVGIVINRFHGDQRLMSSNCKWLEHLTGKPVLGVIPFIHDLFLEVDDTAARIQQQKAKRDTLKVVVPMLRNMTNYTEFDALRLHPKVDFEFVRLNEQIPPADLIILPGSRKVRADLAELRATGWEFSLSRHLRYGGKLVGLCGGFQMLGKMVHDPHGLEGEAGSSEGFGLLDIVTTIAQEKRQGHVRGKLSFADAEVTGYQVHYGVASGNGLQRPLLVLDGDTEGAVSEDGQIAGTHLHGVFDHPEAIEAWLAWTGLTQGLELFDYKQVQEQSLEVLADVLEKHLDWQKLSAYLPV